MDDPAIPSQPSVVPQPPFLPPLSPTSPPLETPVVEVPAEPVPEQIPEEPFLVPPRPATDQPVPPVIPSLDNPPPPPPPPSSPKRTPMKSVIIGLIAVFVIAGGALGFYFFQKGGMNIGKKASEGDQCQYGETCGSGKRCCTGTVQGGSCKYNSSVATNCSSCSSCVPGDCGCGCSGCDSSPTSSPTSSPSEKCCPGGTKDCPSGQQCVRGGSCGNICVSQPYPLPGCCNSGSDCASWETCEEGNGACPSNKSCRSHAGCANSSDCAGGAICVEGTCQGGTSGNVVCEANQSGVKITNTTGADIAGTVEWFSKKCNSQGCSCSGAPATESFTVSKSGGTWSRPISGSGCSWQSDVKVLNSNNPIATGCNNANAGCISGCNPTPPPVAPSSTPVPSPKSCNVACTQNPECASNYCYPWSFLLSACRNQSCPDSLNCVCPPGPSPTNFIQPTPGNVACFVLSVGALGPDGSERDINNLRVGDKISFYVSFRGTVENVAVDLRTKGGGSVQSFYAGGPKTNSWIAPSFTIKSVGSFEAMAFIKSNGEWR